MESTDQGTVENYSGPWIKFREDRSLSHGVTYIFSDGSSSGWHSAVIIKPGKSLRKLCKFEETPNRNINAELNGVILGLEKIESNTKIVVVTDLLHAHAWIIGAWNINGDEVRKKTFYARKLIETKNLDYAGIHHAGHQDRKKKERPICYSEFTKYNVLADSLCSAKEEVDITISLENKDGS